MATNTLLQERPMLTAASGPQAEPLELLLYWRSIYKRKWWILGLGVVCAVIAAVGVSFVTPIYRATVTLMIEQNKAKLVSIDEVYSGVSANREHYQTQAEMLKSPALASTVIRKLGLATHPEFDPRQEKRSFVTDILPGAAPKANSSDWTAEKIETAVLADFLRRITIEPIRLSQLVKLGFDAADPLLAARIANAIAEAYLEADIDVRAKITQRAGDWLADRLSGLKQNLEDSERALQQFREREGLLDTRGLSQGGATIQVEQLNRAREEARQRRVEAENNITQIRAAKGRVEAMPIVLRSGLVDGLKNAEGEAAKRYAALSQRYGPEHPRMIEADRDLR